MKEQEKSPGKSPKETEISNFSIIPRNGYMDLNQT